MTSHCGNTFNWLFKCFEAKTATCIWTALRNKGFGQRRVHISIAEGKVEKDAFKNITSDASSTSANTSGGTNSHSTSLLQSFLWSNCCWRSRETNSTKKLTLKLAVWTDAPSVTTSVMTASFVTRWRHATSVGITWRCLTFTTRRMTSVVPKGAGITSLTAGWLISVGVVAAVINMATMTTMAAVATMAAMTSLWRTRTTSEKFIDVLSNCRRWRARPVSAKRWNRTFIERKKEDCCWWVEENNSVCCYLLKKVQQ